MDQVVPVTSADLDAAEVSWFSALCSDDYQFLGVPDGDLRSSWEHCRDIGLTAEAQGFRNILAPSSFWHGPTHRQDQLPCSHPLWRDATDHAGADSGHPRSPTSPERSPLPPIGTSAATRLWKSCAKRGHATKSITMAKSTSSPMSPLAPRALTSKTVVHCYTLAATPPTRWNSVARNATST